MKASPYRFLVMTVGLAAALATGFITFAPSTVSPGAVREALARLVSPTTVPGFLSSSLGASRHIGIVSGHLGNDSGTVCADGLTEASVNLNIAQRVQDILERQGYTVDLLEEFDPRLNGYQALALVSIHADSCEYINDQATGFKVAGAVDGGAPQASQHLVACLTNRYAAVTSLPFRAGSITRDMTQYHTYSEIDRSTPAAIIETGFLYLDRNFLTQHPDVAAEGIAEGILCFVRNEPLVGNQTSP
ncbi:MAG: N-acetylmuramoyl-L-alanine amidase [Anaerolineales bacterium]|jgi:N-acetylmuramoyl-L-alanine amidase